MALCNRYGCVGRAGRWSGGPGGGVEGVSSIASIDFRIDEWGVDVAISGSQKGFMLPTGLAILCVSQKALGKGVTTSTPWTA